MSKGPTPKVVLVVNGGVLKDIIASQDLEVLLVDDYVDGLENNDPCLEEIDGSEWYCAWGKVKVDKAEVRRILLQLKKS